MKPPTTLPNIEPLTFSVIRDNVDPKGVWRLCGFGDVARLVTSHDDAVRMARWMARTVQSFGGSAIVIVEAARGHKRKVYRYEGSPDSTLRSAKIIHYRRGWNQALAHAGAEVRQLFAEAEKPLKEGSQT